jgi:hypothetical protein
MITPRRLLLISAVVLTVLSVPLSYEGAVQRNKSANFDECAKETAEALPPESPGLPLIFLHEPVLFAGVWCCGSIYFLGSLLSAWLFRHSLVSFGLLGRVIVFLVFFAVPSALCIWEAVKEARWGFWLLALSALLSASAAGMGAYVIFTTVPDVRSHQESHSAIHHLGQ